MAMTAADSERLARIETLLKTLVGNGTDGRCKEHENRMAGYSVRLRRLESWRSWMAGAIAAIGLMLGSSKILRALGL